MAYEVLNNVASFKAGEDLSSNQYRAVILSSDTVIRPNHATTSIPIGILQNKPASGEEAQVALVGSISKFVAAGACAENVWLKSEYVDAADAGKLEATTTDTHPILGICVFAAGAEDDLGSVLITGPGTLAG